MAAGNRSVLVVLDSRRVGECARAGHTVFAALDHFGCAYEVHECGDYMGIPPNYVTPRAAYVLAHDGAGAGLKPEVAAAIAQAVKHGAGLVSFDREPEAWPQPLKALVPWADAKVTTAKLRFPAAPGFITFGHEPDEEVELRRSIEAATIAAGSGFEGLVTAASGECVVACGRAGEGRVVAFGTGDGLYAEAVFGHTRGLDGLMWRALVWAARKPFPMRSIPPFVSARMDDCNGAYCAFGYVDVLNRYGIAPNLGLFIDEMGPTDWAAAKRLFDKGGADFSMHAFRDDLYRARPNFKSFAILPDKPDLSDGGKHTLFEGLSLDHTTGRDLDDATVERNFGRMDEAFARAGIRHSRILNAHFGEIAWRAVERFLARGVDLACNNSVVGQLYGNQPHWRPKPYGARGTNGRHGIVIDRCAQHPGLTLVGCGTSHIASSHMGSDILSGNVPFLGESEVPRLREATDRGIANVRLGLDSLAFGNIMTHEERIDAISPEDWETVITSIVRGLDGWDTEFAACEHVSVVCKSLLDSALVHAHAADGALHCELSGVTDSPSPLTIWDNEGDACTRRVVEVEPIEGFTTVDVT